MNVEDFKWDDVKQCVSWGYNGHHIINKYDNAYFASLNLENQYVIVEVGKNFTQDQLYYLSFNGKQIFLVDKVNDKVSWWLQDQLFEVNCEHILSAQIYFHEGVVIVISMENQIGKSLKGYKMDGTLLFVKHPPEGFDFNYLSTFNKQPSVICSGDKDSIDAYGRNSWNFIINTRTGEMIKGNLAY